MGFLPVGVGFFTCYLNGCVHIHVKLQWYAPIKIIGIKISVPIKSEKSLRLMVHISKTLTKSLR
jgi:hypothetical protein